MNLGRNGVVPMMSPFPSSHSTRLSHLFQASTTYQSIDALMENSSENARTPEGTGKGSDVTPHAVSHADVTTPTTSKSPRRSDALNRVRFS